jgi:hypothetical protein
MQMSSVLHLCMSKEGAFTDEDRESAELTLAFISLIFITRESCGDTRLLHYPRHMVRIRTGIASAAVINTAIVTDVFLPQLSNGTQTCLMSSMIGRVVLETIWPARGRCCQRVHDATIAPKPRLSLLHVCAYQMLASAHLLFSFTPQLGWRSTLLLNLNYPRIGRLPKYIKS